MARWWPRTVPCMTICTHSYGHVHDPVWLVGQGADKNIQPMVAQLSFASWDAMGSNVCDSVRALYRTSPMLRINAVQVDNIDIYLF